MDDRTSRNWAAALQTAGAFFVTVVALVLGLLDALCGAKSAIGDLALATVGAAAFASSLSTTANER